MTGHDEVVAPQPARINKDRRQLPSWRWEELRTTLWVIPSILIVVSALLFVVTFVYSVLVLGSIDSVSKAFVPYLSTSVAEALLLVDLGVLIYFIHHIAKSIQLPEVIAGIADDLMEQIGAA